MVLAAAMQEWFGDQGIYMLSIVSGLADVDAITISLSRLALGELSEQVAVMGIVLASGMNTIVKGFIFAFFVGYKESLQLIGLLFLSAAIGIITAFVLVI